MNVQDLRQLIREEMRTVMREELREILVEAVEVASRTPAPEQPVHKPTFATPDWVNELRVQTEQKKPAAETSSHPVMGKGHDAMMALLVDTAKTATDLRNFM